MSPEMNEQMDKVKALFEAKGFTERHRYHSAIVFERNINGQRESVSVEFWPGGGYSVYKFVGYASNLEYFQTLFDRLDTNAF